MKTGLSLERASGDGQADMQGVTERRIRGLLRLSRTGHQSLVPSYIQERSRSQ